MRPLAGSARGSPVPARAPRRAEVTAHRRRLRQTAKVRAGQPRQRARSPVLPRHATFQRGACRAQLPAARQVRAARRRQRVRKFLPAGLRIRRSTQTRPGLRPISRAVRSRVSADPPLVRPVEAPARPPPLQGPPPPPLHSPPPRL